MKSLTSTWLLVFLLLSACGGGSSGTDKSVQPPASAITSHSNGSIPSSLSMPSTSSAISSAADNLIVNIIEIGPNWFANGAASTISVRDDVLIVAPTASGQGAGFIVSDMELEGARIDMVVNPNTAFINSGASLQIAAQIRGGEWIGEWDCWFANAELKADIDQTISCVIDEDGAFNRQTNYGVQIVIQAARKNNEPDTVSGIVLVKSVSLTLANPVNSSTASSSFSSSLAPLAEIPVSNFILVDQFGYLPEGKKIAIVRDPHTGYDAHLSFTPSGNYQVINVEQQTVALNITPIAWNNGQTYAVAGDKTWWLDFSNLSTAGTYTLVDVHNNVRSPNFKIAADVYKLVLRHAFRTFYYQRAGFAKAEPFADSRWTDAASHLKPGQDSSARSFFDKTNAATAKDLSGGWYDAGDYNKYTNWHADYLIALLHMYLENPLTWGDDFNLPDSGNGIPDIIDEIKWGFDWLKKMQESDGSMLSILGLDGASPPSATSGPSYYGKVSTSATLTSASAFALGGQVLAMFGNNDLTAYANDLKTRAEHAWGWAIANPNIIFHNNEVSFNSLGLGAGDQEVGPEQRAFKKIQAAIYLFAATEDTKYQTLVDAFVQSSSTYPSGIQNWVNFWNEKEWTAYLYYSGLNRVNPVVANKIKTIYNTGYKQTDSWKTLTNTQAGGYRATIAADDFTWGSNRSMAKAGNLLFMANHYGADTSTNFIELRDGAVSYLNYLHGVNPQGMVYLSNMYDLGVHSSVNEFYHTWFTNGSSNWDRVGDSSFGPAPGFLVGGPNPTYKWDDCCKNNSCGVQNNAVCTSMSLIPPKQQPAMKSYLDFNTSWPLNSWQITENHNDYQVAYLRLLSNFVKN
jgi:endoglucanase